MVNYHCFRCGYTNNNKSVFRRHILRMNICKPHLEDININDIFEHYFPKHVAKNQVNVAKIDPNVAKIEENVAKNQVNVANEVPNIIEENEKFTCKYCNKKFKHNASRYKHERDRCKKKEEYEKKHNNKVDLDKKTQILLDAKVKELEEQKKKEIEELKKSFMDKLDIVLKKKDEETMQLITTSKNRNRLMTNTNCNVDARNQNFNLVLNLNSYKNTDHSHLRDQDYLECIRKGNMGIPYLIEKIHFNPEKPENHNIFVNNIKSDYIKLFDDGKWKTAMQYETVNMMVQDKANLVEDKIEEWYDTNHKYCGKKYKEILDKYPRFLNRLTDSKYVGRKVEQESKLVLFNKKDMPIDYTKKIDQKKDVQVQNEHDKDNLLLANKIHKTSNILKKEIFNLL